MPSLILFFSTVLGIITSLTSLFFGQKTLPDIVKTIRTKKIVPITVNPFLLVLCFFSIIILTGTTIFLNVKLATLTSQAPAPKPTVETLGSQSSPSPVDTLTATTGSTTPGGSTPASSSPIKTTILSKPLTCQSCPDNSPTITLDNVPIDLQQKQMVWNITMSYPSGPLVTIAIDQFDLVGSDIQQQVGSVQFAGTGEIWSVFDPQSKASATVTFTNFIPSKGEQLTLEVSTHEERVVGETYATETFVPVTFTYNGSILIPS